MNSTDRPSNPASTSNELTRRNFMKKTALTMGAITLLGGGNGFANLGESRVKYCLHSTCDGYTADQPEVYIDKPFGPGVTVTYFTIGKCKCSYGLTQSQFAAWEIALPPADQEIFDVRANDDRPKLQHTAGHNLPRHAEH